MAFNINSSSNTSGDLQAQEEQGALLTSTPHSQQVQERKGGLQVSELSFTYPNASAATLDSLSFSISAGSRVLLAGTTGSGKSTLLRCLKKELTPAGELRGRITIHDDLLTGRTSSKQEHSPKAQASGMDLRYLDAGQSAGSIGFVMQDPRQQIVMDTVEAELAFGLENLGTPQELMQRRVAEIAHYFGINSWLHRNTSELSGGEMQLVNLASIIAMQPKMILMDEPTAALDPIAAREFIQLALRLNDELGITLVIVEHNLEDLLSAMNQVLYLEQGHVTFDGETRSFAAWMHETKNPNETSLPTAARFYLAQARNEALKACCIPLEVKEGRSWLWHDANKDTLCFGKGESSDESSDESSHKKSSPSKTNTAPDAKSPHPQKQQSLAAHTVLEAKRVWFRYQRNKSYVLKDLSLKVVGGTIIGLVGANASGKSTLLSLLSGAEKPQHGKINVTAGVRLALLPQDPSALFLKDTVFEDLMEQSKYFGVHDEAVKDLLLKMGLENKETRHPYDLSRGEQQKLALAKVLLGLPDVLILDEPTAGLDAAALETLAELLKELRNSGKTIVMASHNLEFVAAIADECLMLFDGAVIGRAPTQEFFSGNLFYTTALRRITQGILEESPVVLAHHKSPAGDVVRSGREEKPQNKKQTEEHL